MKITRRPVTKTVVSINVVLFAVYLLTRSVVMVNYNNLFRALMIRHQQTTSQQHQQQWLPLPCLCVTFTCGNQRCRRMSALAEEARPPQYAVAVRTVRQRHGRTAVWSFQRRPCLALPIARLPRDVVDPQGIVLRTVPPCAAPAAGSEVAVVSRGLQHGHRAAGMRNVLVTFKASKLYVYVNHFTSQASLR